MEKLERLKKSLAQELTNILSYWENNTVDEVNGGFIGHIDYPDKKRFEANKGIILNTRILWSFSAASNFYKSTRYAHLCKRSYDYLKTCFKDNVHGGVYWEVDYKGNPVNKRKQVYAQAFTIYALSEYFLCSQNEEAKQWAVEIFELIQHHASDPEYGGYIEAFTEDWSPVEDMRLSDKDDNEAKTMNTHLHILEAYTTLYKIYPEATVKNALNGLVNIFLDKFLDKNGHLHLFFDEQWNLKSSVYSYGHDIETAWLMIEAAKTTGDKDLIKKTEKAALRITNTFINEAIDKDGAVKNEINFKTGHVDTDRHWWQQAEAIVGLYYAYLINNDEKYIDIAVNIWKFIDKKVIDHTYGEWFWLIDENGNFNPEDEKAGMWKCPYHNSRAAIQLNLK
ncbi:AGE family epimerase/isomerase [Abyssalbus ytuae]|uniref:Cellobiose 2-epimerase n=1 Tax=Abyssalbus ytuae TaxID=2926907 RepID=A0A9E6ZTW4_9FLAO|nr:AGE family epimerase/isomerase [Abyssalbus ytuae]UOB18813.1 AGE family epimerase/isomerase [Abyssalbus ytuae]